MRSLLLLLISGMFVFTFGDTSAQVNDLCSGATTITCGQTVSGNTTTAGVDGISAINCPTPESPGVWYRFTGNGQSVIAAIGCNGGAWDTYINVYSGSCTNLTCVTESDDDGDCPDLESQAVFSTTNGVSYYILVYGYDVDEYGSFTLTLTCGTQTCNMSASVSTTSESLAGAGDGTATASASGGTAPFSYQWSNGQTGYYQTGLETGTYYVTITDANGCTATASGYVPVDGSSCNLSATTSTSAESFPGGMDGSATAYPSGGTAPYSYSWSNGYNTQSIGGLSNGTYTVTVYDNSGCNYVTTAVVGSGGGTNCDVAGYVETWHQGSVSNDGYGFVTPTSGGSSTYSYSWSTGDGGDQSYLPSPGTYYVTITDLVSGCTGIAAGTLNSYDPNCTDLAVVVPANESAAGNDGWCQVYFSGGSSTTNYFYSWSNGSNGYGQEVINGLSEGIYYVTITDPFTGCDYVASGYVNGNGSSSCNLGASVTTTNESAAGANNGSATAYPSNGTQPFSYQWSNGQSTSTINNLAPGTYTVTITDGNGCTAVASGTVMTGGTSCNMTASVGTYDESSAGANDGSAGASASNGTAPYSYQWSSGQTTSNINNLSPGTYTVTITDANGCTATASGTVGTGGSSCNMTASVSTYDESAPGANNGSAGASASNGTAPYSYQWSSGQTTSNINNLSPGTYTVTITDANGCTATASGTVGTGGTSCNLTASVDAYDESSFGANDGSADAYPSNGTAPYSYSWSNGQTTASISNLSPGSYEVTITDGNGCTATATGYVGSGACDLTVNISSTNESYAGASDGSATAYPSGGTAPYSYAWSNSTYSSTASGLAPGSYSVTVTDANGCSETAYVTISGGSCALSVSINGVDESFIGSSDGEATALPVNGNAPFTYSWSNGGNTQTISNLAPGTYSVTVTDASGCTATATVTINPANCTLTVSVVGEDETIPGSSDGSAAVFASGGTAPYSYTWSTGGNGSSISGLGSGNYSVTVTDQSGCTKVGNVTINSGICDLTVTVSATSETAGNDGSAVASANGGTAPYSYSWSNGGSSSAISSLSSGTYYVTVTDSKGCMEIGTAIVNGSGCSVTVSVTGTDASSTFASDGTASCTASGGVSPYTYSWSGVSASTSSVSGLTAGEYCVTATDLNGCSASNCVTIGNGCTAGSSGVITGSSTPTINTTEVYSVSGVAGSSYTWNVTKGSIISGQGTSSITVQWTTIGYGYVSVSETQSNGCENEATVKEVFVDWPSSIAITAPSLDWSVYPNPNSGVFSVQLSAALQSVGYLNVVDLTGRTIQQISIQGENLIQVELEDVSQGMYFITLDYEGERLIKRIIIN